MRSATNEDDHMEFTPGELVLMYQYIKYKHDTVAASESKQAQVEIILRKLQEAVANE